MKPNLLIIYTGGTIGMVNNPQTNSLTPLNFKHITNQVPEIESFHCNIDTYEFDNPIDSSNVNPEFWIHLVRIIKKNYAQYDGFLILHGTDTMAHTASVLSFLIQNIDKPIVLTGSQLPIGTIRTDGKENLITSIEIAIDKINEQSIINEVCVCFENKLYRGNRVSKTNAEYFNAFSSDNYPPLAEIGIHIHYKKAFLLPKTEKQAFFSERLSSNVAILKIFPGMGTDYVKAVLNTDNVEAVIMETYGSGNAPTEAWFIDLLEEAKNKGIYLINVSQCKAGKVMQGHYETSLRMKNLGVIGASDMTSEAALTKCMFLLANKDLYPCFETAFTQSISGELTL